MVYIAVRNVKGKNYFYVAESIRNEHGEPRQKKVIYIGDKEALSRLHENIKKKLLKD